MWGRKAGTVKTFVGFGVMILVAACAPVGTPGATSQGPIKPTTTTLRMMVTPEPNDLNRVRGTSDALNPVVLNVMEPLIRLDANGKPVPSLATQWEYSPDLKTWRFTLRKGVKFHSGSEFTAQDVVDTARWLIDEQKVSQLYIRIPLTDVVAVDDYTVSFVFKTPQPLLFTQIPYLLIYPSSIAKANRARADTVADGTGPYQFVEWNRGQNIKLARFDGYWGTKPQIKDVQVTFRAEANVRVAALKAGEVDWVQGLSPDDVGQLPKTVTLVDPNTIIIRFDESIIQNPLFADKRLRLAVDMAVDRKAIVALYAGLATEARGQMAVQGEFGFNATLKNRAYDLQMAKALVQEAGAVGKTVTLVGKQGTWSKDAEVAQAVASMVEQTGLKVKLTLLGNAEFQNYLRVQDPARGLYVSDLLVNIFDTLGEAESRGQKLFVQGGTIYALNDLHSTDLYKAELAETDLAKREAALQQIWAYVYEQAHYVPIARLPAIWGIAKNLEWKPDLSGSPFVPSMRFTD